MLIKGDGTLIALSVIIALIIFICAGLLSIIKSFNQKLHQKKGVQSSDQKLDNGTQNQINLSLECSENSLGL